LEDLGWSRLVVVEEGKLARLLHKLVPDLEPDLLDKVDRL